jgi:hypothetical protein
MIDLARFATTPAWRRPCSVYPIDAITPSARSM